MKRSLKRLVLAIAVLQILYLAVANPILSLPRAQALLNEHRPDQYAVHWDSAWTWYPLRVHARGISANGQTSGQQWQADVTAASATLSVLPLLQRTVRIHDVDVEDIVFRLRPRPKPEKDYAAIQAFFPPIQGRELDLPTGQPKPKKAGKLPTEQPEPKKDGKSWRIIVDDALAHGSHDVWVFQARADFDGELATTNIGFETRGGPLSVESGQADLVLRSMMLNQDWEVSKDATLKGDFSISPFSPVEHKGLNALGFLSVDVQIDAPVDSLDFLDFYLRRSDGIELDGKGRVIGRLTYHQGNLMSGTDLSVSAGELVLTAAPYLVKGDGRIGIAVRPESPDMLLIDIVFGSLNAYYQDDEATLFSGEQLQVSAQGPTTILPADREPMGLERVSITIPTVSVPDLRAYQRYLPDKWGVRLQGGHGELEGSAELSPTAMTSNLHLQSADADISFKDYRFNTNLNLGLMTRADADQTPSLDLSGSYLRLDQAKVIGGGAEAASWQADFKINKGTMTLALPDGGNDPESFADLSRAPREQDLKTLLTSANARLDASLDLSDLSWINLLFTNPFQLAVSGAGEIAADLRISAGWLDKGTRLDVTPRGLKVHVLDYVADGAGTVSMTVEKGGERPNLRLEGRLGDAKLKRQGEDKAVVEQVNLVVSALATQVAFRDKDSDEGGGGVGAIDLSILSARVTDMTVYNGYLPEGAPLRLLGGEADLIAEVHLEPDAADGMVRLQTRGLKARLDDQRISGELVLDILLKDGVPMDMDFDISGSSLRLNSIKVAGEHASFDQSDWRARFDLTKARVVWTKPITLDLQAGIQMQDSRPIVAMFSNQRGKNGWLEKMITVEDVRGEARMRIESNRIVIPKAFAGSDKIDIGAKGVIDAKHREGIFFARYGALKGILKVKNGERNFDILGARKKFDAYVPGKTALKVGRGDPDEADSPTDDAGDSGDADKDAPTTVKDDVPEKDKAPKKKKKTSKDEKPFSILDDISDH